MHTLLQWPIPATPAAPTQSLPSTALATPSPASSTAPAVRCNKMFLRKTLENRPQHTHSKSLISRQDPLERTVNELPLHPARANQGHRPASDQGSRRDRNPGPLPRSPAIDPRFSSQAPACSTARTSKSPPVRSNPSESSTPVRWWPGTCTSPAASSAGPL